MSERGPAATIFEFEGAWEAIDEFIVSHLEQHAEQLELLASGHGEGSSAS